MLSLAVAGPLRLGSLPAFLMLLVTKGHNHELCAAQFESHTWHHKADEAIRHSLRLWADWEAAIEPISSGSVDQWQVSHGS